MDGAASWQQSLSASARERYRKALARGVDAVQTAAQASGSEAEARRGDLAVEKSRIAEMPPGGEKEAAEALHNQKVTEVHACHHVLHAHLSAALSKTSLLTFGRTAAVLSAQHRVRHRWLTLPRTVSAALTCYPSCHAAHPFAPGSPCPYCSWREPTSSPRFSARPLSAC